MPSPPPAHSFFLLKKRSYSFFLGVFSCCTQARPPSREGRTTPPRPTIQPSSPSTNPTLNNVERTGELTATHDCPPSVVRRIVPCSPTVHPRCSLRKPM